LLRRHDNVILFAFAQECGRPRPQLRPNCDTLFVSPLPTCSATLLRPGTGALRRPVGKLPRRARPTAAAKIILDGRQKQMAFEFLLHQVNP